MSNESKDMSKHHAMNILSKVDKSLVGEQLGKPVSKITRYDWTTGGSKGWFRWIPKTDLNIDGRYQREQVSEDKVISIAKKWDWLLVGTLSVIEREDGTFWVFDGGHRTRAAFYRDDVTEMPCMVHSLASVNDEAKAFVARNTMLSKVSSFDRFHAAKCADEPVAKALNAMLTKFDLRAVKGGYDTGKFISCVGALQKCIQEDEADAEKALGFALKLAGDQVVTGKTYEALFTLQRHFKPNVDIIDRYGEKLLRHSQRELERKMTEFSTLCGKSGCVVWAKALLELINYKVRNRLEW